MRRADDRARTGTVEDDDRALERLLQLRAGNGWLTHRVRQTVVRPLVGRTIR